MRTQVPLVQPAAPCLAQQLPPAARSHAESRAGSGTILMELEIIPIQQVQAIVPSRSGVNSIRFSPGTSRVLMLYKVNRIR